MTATVRVAFYVPSPDLVRHAPAAAADYWPWIATAVETMPAQLGDGRGICPWLGPYNWTLQTYLELRDSGFDCELTASLPADGVIIAHGDFLPPGIAPSARQFIVEIKPDRPLQCRFANFAITQNTSDPICQRPARLFVRAAALPYWPQPGLVPRDDARGDRFENIGFMGRAQNFLDDTDAVSTGLEERGLNWVVVPVERWHDYTALDAVVAVRPPADVSRSEAVPFQAANRKPASKLVNAWLAGVPAILSPDEAFRQLRTSPLDYLEAESVADVLARVDQLRHDAGLRRAMVDRGRQRAAEFTRSRVTSRWAALISEEIVPAAEVWRTAPTRRAAFFAARAIAHAFRWRIQQWLTTRERAR
ncbi:MAG: glycosyltransferase [Vicinamibacterales bacterium]